ncbi:cell division protein FtsL [Candidatus Aminicenantes bacterium AC-708-M15]|jgi:cell division protein FtsL|nr:cell division protein FtsL [SCandidatus Aminicenantes bacterium Aminicenantia_JdfR_composite]MCP2604045.1 cell division protein FtsL [Candidatus Aminicenantes bacterium AC-708-M15]MCP2618324.1 cell division protein FtsL [Candidatus Aminicenantes bacterium AC-335-A11]
MSKKTKKKEILKVIVVGIIIVILFIFYIWRHMEGVKLGYEIEKLRKEKEILNEEIKKLKLKKMNYLNLERVEKIAIEELKLVYPKSSQIIVWDKKSLRENE